MKNEEQLINNVIGQLEGIKRMIEEEKDCGLVLVQLQASKSALNAFVNKYIENNALSCLKDNCSRKGRAELKELLKQLTKNNL